MEHILVPLDGSHFSEHSLLTAIALARRDGAVLHLMTVAARPNPPRMLEGAEGVAEQLRSGFEAASEHYLEGTRNRILHAAPEVEVRVAVGTGPVVDVLTEEVRKSGVDLVVMTSHGRGPFRRAWLGSIADGLIRSSACPVLLLRPPQAERPTLLPRPPFRRVLIPIDGSVAARRIFPDVVRVVGSDAHYTLLQSIGVGLNLPPGSAPAAAASGTLADEIEEIARSTLELASQELRDLGVEQIDTKVVHGSHAAEEIVAYAELREVDLIAMSTHGEGGIARLLLGSTADKVARSAECPVLLHRTG